MSLLMLLVSLLVLKVISLFAVLFVSFFFFELTHKILGRNVIIEQSFGGPKITKGIIRLFVPIHSFP